VVAHLTLATILWGTVVYAATSLIALPETSRAVRPEESGGARETQAVTA
jgi:hypothetical protein